MSPLSATPFRSAGAGCRSAMNIIFAISLRHTALGRMSGGGSLWQGVQICRATAASFAGSVFVFVCVCVSRETASTGSTLRPIVTTSATAIAIKGPADRDIRRDANTYCRATSRPRAG